MSKTFDMTEKLATENIYVKIKKWISYTSGEFTAKDIDYDLGIITPFEKMDRTLALKILENENVIEQTGKRNGNYRQAKKDLIEMDFVNADEKPVQLWFPLGIHERVNIMPGNIIQVNGEKNSGKTAFSLNIAKNNMHKWNVHYFNSEMGPGELKMRLKLFENKVPSDWTMKAYERSGDFADVIFPGEGNLNIIDFLEMHDEFYRMGEYMRSIHEKLQGAVAVINVQKNYGSEMGLGGSRTEEKPRLILNISNGKIKVKMAKNWKNENPNNKILDFKLVNGCKFIRQGDWYREKES